LRYGGENHGHRLIQRKEKKEKRKGEKERYMIHAREPSGMPLPPFATPLLPMNI
jgi:hypothetical protein